MSKVKEARELLAFHGSISATALADNCKFGFHAHCTKPDYCHCVCHDELEVRAPELLSTLCNEVEELRRRNETQSDSIMEFQQEQKAFHAAASELLDALVKAVVYAPNVKKAADALRSAITPKGTQK